MVLSKVQALLRSKPIPSDGFGSVFRYTLALSKTLTEIKLSEGFSLIRSKPKPPDSLRVIVSPIIMRTQSKLSVEITLISGQPIPLDGLGLVLGQEMAHVI